MNNRFRTFVLSSFCITSVVTSGGIFLTEPTLAATVAPSNDTAKWMTVDRAAHTVTVKTIADYSGDNSGMNFNGYSRGAMNVEVPQGWTVKVVFQNHGSMMPHSLMIVPYSQRTLVSGFSSAFKGASTAHPTQGIMHGATQSFSFKASKSGTFAMVCGMPGHSARGMWDKLTISTKVKTPEVLVTETVQSNGATGTAGTGPTNTTGYGSDY